MAKYIKKCAICNKRASRKVRGISLCLEHTREVNKLKKVKGVYGEKLEFSIGEIKVYKNVYIPFK